MLKEERQIEILEKIRKKGNVETVDLAKEFDVSLDTIRKDLQELNKNKKLVRVHGGAIANDKPVLELEDREKLYTKSKIKVSKLTKNLLLDLPISNIFIDGSSTNELVAKELIKESFKADIITNSPRIALKFSEANVENIYLIGGLINKKNKNTEGSKSLEEIKKLNIQYLLMGVGVIDIKGGISSANLDETIAKRELIKKSNKIICPIAHEKFGSASLHKVCEIKDIDYIISDKIPNEYLSYMKEYGINFYKESI